MWEEERTPAWAVLLFIALFVGAIVATAYIWAYLGGFLAGIAMCCMVALLLRWDRKRRD